MSCVKLLKKFLKLLVHRERADYFPYDSRTALGVLLCPRVTEVGKNFFASTGGFENIGDDHRRRLSLLP